MTEKRFTISSESNQNIWDNRGKCYYSSIDAERLCKLLNEFNEENEQLKSENEELKKRDNLVSSYLTDEGIITFEKYNEIVDYLYKKWQKRNGDVE